MYMLYSSTCSGKIKLSKIPINAAKLIPVIEKDKLLFEKDITAPLKPSINIVDTIITFLILLKSILFSVNTFKPFTEINP